MISRVGDLRLPGARLRRHLPWRPSFAVSAPAYTPRTNGKAEHFIQTRLREGAYRRPCPTPAARRHALGSWVHRYNGFATMAVSRVVPPGAACWPRTIS